MKNILIFFIIGTWLCAAAPAASKPSSPASVKLTELRKNLNDISSVSGHFVQIKKLDFLNNPLISEGVFHFSRPDFLSWEYVKPTPSGLIIEGGRVQAWTGPSAAKVKQPEAMAEAARMAAGQVMIWMKMESEAILAAYEVSLVSERPLILKVVPKRGGARRFIQHLEVEFNIDERTVKRVILFESESRTTLEFERVILNRPRPVQ